MEKDVKRVLKSHFDKYDIPQEAIDAAVVSLVQLLKNPLKYKYGAYVMTEEASSAGDSAKIKDDLKNQDRAKPQEF